MASSAMRWGLRKIKRKEPSGWRLSSSTAMHPHMLRHACGFKLANDSQDTRALQHYLGHKNIQHTVRYTELSPERFRDFWKD
jgi:type 1 fimbriae regulatory protein FimB/type 1 fimbriae regulatory protein FimE